MEKHPVVQFRSFRYSVLAHARTSVRRVAVDIPSGGLAPTA